MRSWTCTDSSPWRRKRLALLVSLLAAWAMGCAGPMAGPGLFPETLMGPGARLVLEPCRGWVPYIFTWGCGRRWLDTGPAPLFSSRDILQELRDAGGFSRWLAERTHTYGSGRRGWRPPTGTRPGQSSGARSTQGPNGHSWPAAAGARGR